MRLSGKKYITVLLAASAVLLSSCGKDSENIKETEAEITVSTSVVSSETTDTENALTSVSSGTEKGTGKGTETTSAASVSGTTSAVSGITANSSVSDASSASNEKKPETKKTPANTPSPEDKPAPPITEPNIIPSNLENKPGMPQETEEPAPPPETETEPEETDPPVPENSDVTVKLNGSSAECSSDKVSVNGSSVTITAEGIYKLSGDLDGQIIVNAPKDVQVILELDGVNIRNSNDSAILIESCDKVKISSAAGTTNTLSDGGASSACIYSKDDLTLKGEGTIIINGVSKNAVYSKNTLKVTGGTLEINSANNALTGKDKVIVETGNITINAGKDGIKATNDTDSGKGTVAVTGGTLTINAGDDAIQAISGVTLSGCSVRVKAEGKKVNCDVNVAVDEGCISKIQ